MITELNARRTLSQWLLSWTRREHYRNGNRVERDENIIAMVTELNVTEHYRNGNRVERDENIIAMVTELNVTEHYRNGNLVGRNEGNWCNRPVRGCCVDWVAMTNEIKLTDYCYKFFFVNILFPKLFIVITAKLASSIHYKWLQKCGSHVSSVLSPTHVFSSNNEEETKKPMNIACDQQRIFTKKEKCWRVTEIHTSALY